jgi:hypothetical protein
MDLFNIPPFHIAIFDCDTPVPSVYAERGLYSHIFEVLLRDAQKKTSELQDLDLKFRGYDCVQGQLPSEQELRKIDAIIITGSCEFLFLSQD